MGGTAGVSGCSECSRSSLQSNGGLDWSSFLSIAAIHQHHQIHTLLLLQKGTMNTTLLDTYTSKFTMYSNVSFVSVCLCQITLFQNCQPATRNFRSTTSNFFFLLVLLFGWMLSSVVLLYSVAKSVRPVKIYAVAHRF